MIGNDLLLGAFAGVTIFLGLPVARAKSMSDAMRGALALVSAGILVFLIIEIGYHAMEQVEKMAIAGAYDEVAEQGLVLAGGVALGLVGLAWIEEMRRKRRKAGASELEIAMMIAIGIGAHNFAEGLAIGSSFAGGAASLGWVLVIGFALHNATEGFGIAAPVAGKHVSWMNILWMGLIGGGPTAIGAVVGGSYTNDVLNLFFLSLALGSLIYVTREIFRIRFETLKPVAGMSALCLGLFLGIGTEVIVEVGQARAAESVATAGGVNVRFEGKTASAETLAVKRGQTITIENATESTLVFEGEGLFPGEVAISPKGSKTVGVRGREGEYKLTDEDGRSAVVKVQVQPEQTS